MAGPEDLRVSDEQRDRAAQEIREHFAAGRLTDDELSDRVQAAYSARTEQELRTLLPTCPSSPRRRRKQKAELAARRSMLQRRMLQEAGGGLGLFVICTAIWARGRSTRHGQFWPIWVLLVALIPLLRNGWRLYGPRRSSTRSNASSTRAVASTSSAPSCAATPTTAPPDGRGGRGEG